TVWWMVSGTSPARVTPRLTRRFSSEGLAALASPTARAASRKRGRGRARNDIIPFCHAGPVRDQPCTPSPRCSPRGDVHDSHAPAALPHSLLDRALVGVWSARGGRVLQRDDPAEEPASGDEDVEREEAELLSAPAAPP